MEDEGGAKNDALAQAIARFIEHLDAERRASRHTVSAYASDLTSSSASPARSAAA